MKRYESHKNKRNNKKRHFLYSYDFFYSEMFLGLVIMAAIYIEVQISNRILSIGYWYWFFKFLVLLILYLLFHYNTRKSLFSVSMSVLLWTIMDCLLFCYMRFYSQDVFVSPPCKVTYYKHTNARGSSSGITYIYEGEKHHLYYVTPQLDSLADSDDDENRWDKIELRLKLNKICPSVYYIKDFDIKVKK